MERDSVLLQPQVEAGRCVDVEHPHDLVAAVGERVLDPRRDEDERARSGDHLLAFDPEGELALEDEERIVLAACACFGGPSRCGWISITAKLKRGVSALRARNSTLPTR